MKPSKHALLAFSIAVTCGVANAGPTDSNYGKAVIPEPDCGPYYISVFGGGSFFENGDFTLTANPANTANYNLDEGWIAGAALGFRTANNFRFEFEFNHSEGDVDFRSEFTNGVFGFGDSTTGSIETNAYMFNVIKDFGQGRLRPYLGAGIGVADISVGPITDTFAFDFIQGGSTEFGYQFIAGVTYNLSDCLQPYLEYRASSHSDFDIFEPAITGWGGNGNLDLGWSQHVVAGIRYFF